MERGEDGGTEEFRLDRSGRYQHAEAYLRRELVQAGMMVETLETVELRLEGGHPVVGFLVLARKPRPARGRKHDRSKFEEIPVNGNDDKTKAFDDALRSRWWPDGLIRR